MTLLSILLGLGGGIAPEGPIIIDVPFIPRDLNEFALSLLEDLPPSMWEDSDIQGLIQVYGRALEEAYEKMAALQEAAFPQLTEDYLHFWEYTLGITVNPEDLSNNQRRTRILGLLRNMNSNSSRTNWEEAVTAYLGSEDWSYQINTPGDYQIQISIPYVEGGTRANDVERFLRVITPAHEEIVVTYGDSFLLDISELGDPL